MLIEVRESSQAGEARRRATELAKDLQLGEVRCGSVALAATEMATNLVKHAGNGTLLLQRLQENGSSGLRLIAIDKGPGIANLTRAMEDGHSTAGSMGTGLGAVRRMSDIFEVYSATEVGTLIRVEFWQDNHHNSRPHGALKSSAVSEPMHGEEECGDGWGRRLFADSLVLMVVDGLGHGVFAAEAAREAEQVLARAQDDSPLHILEDIHGSLRKTRGAAVAVARIQETKGLLSFAGVGNISASIVSPGTSRSMASHNGTVGHHMPRIQEFTYPWNADSTLIMHSDGLGSRWDLERYPGIWGKHPSLISAVLHRDFCRGRDDVTVLVAKTS
ncbi:MAG: ATP-binding SpoIIE family protein phosphatase [Candidatus Sulfotelmatobacter sp.]